MYLKLSWDLKIIDNKLNSYTHHIKYNVSQTLKLLPKPSESLRDQLRNEEARREASIVLIQHATYALD